MTNDTNDRAGTEVLCVDGIRIGCKQLFWLLMARGKQEKKGEPLYLLKEKSRISCHGLVNKGLMRTGGLPDRQFYITQEGMQWLTKRQILMDLLK